MMSMEDFSKLGSQDRDPGTARGMAPVSAPSSSLSPACLVYICTPAGPGPTSRAQGPFSLSPNEANEGFRLSAGA